ncbi:hypothetical protein FA95DRAFT_1576651 [Auriscalpium vulgare]|uniref:Uncharacterized protein n=1 Tax=Auriscalpium vulgare TaxID=40419 RepID=A0ACB8RAJ6_9AGAM|nr:hypothetical protein FA95DRAFT_1576651 [Auriscalpium vulgare]
MPINPAPPPPPFGTSSYLSRSPAPRDVPVDENAFSFIDPAVLTAAPSLPHPPPPPPPVPVLTTSPPPARRPIGDIWHCGGELLVSFIRIDHLASTKRCWQWQKVCAAVRLFVNFLILYPDPEQLMSVANHILYANETRLKALAERFCRPMLADNVCAPVYASSQINTLILGKLRTPSKLYKAQDCSRLTFQPVKDACRILPDAELRLRVGSVCTLMKSLPHRDLYVNAIVVVVRVGEVSVTVKALHDPTPIILCRADFVFHQRGQRCSFRRSQIPLQLAYQRHYRHIRSSAELTKRGMEDLPLSAEDIEDDSIALVDDLDLSWSDSDTTTEDSDSSPPPLEPISPSL